MLQVFCDYLCDETSVTNLEQVTKGMVNSGFRGWYHHRSGTAPATANSARRLGSFSASWRKRRESTMPALSRRYDEISAICNGALEARAGRKRTQARLSPGSWWAPPPEPRIFISCSRHCQIAAARIAAENRAASAGSTEFCDQWSNHMAFQVRAERNLKESSLNES
jgi:hypothetical protein